METKKTEAAARVAWREHYARLHACLAAPGWISEGYVQDRGPGAGPPMLSGARPVQGKAVHVALHPRRAASTSRCVHVALRPQEQSTCDSATWLSAAIANGGSVQATLKAMQQLSRSVLFTTLPDTHRRKRLSKRVLGIT